MTIVSNATPDLEVKYRGVRITGTLKAQNIVVWNSGKLAIEHADILQPVVLHVQPPSKIVDVQVTGAARALSEFRVARIDRDAGEIVLDWKILETGDGGKIRVIYEGNEDDLNVEFNGAVKGQRDLLVERGNYERTTRRASEPFAKSFANLGITMLVAGGGVAGIMLLIRLIGTWVASKSPFVGNVFAGFLAAIIGAAIVTGIGAAVWSVIYMLFVEPPSPPF